MPPSLQAFIASPATYAADDPLAKVQRLDAENRHGEAIDLLARETRFNNLDATTLLAKRLVFGDRAPFLPLEGARFLQEAAQRGCGEAATQLAVFLALGMYLPQSWSEALAMLRRGAEQGWKPAQGQVLALATDRVLAERALGSALAPREWRRLGESIDLDYWLSAAPQDTLCADPGIFRVPAFMPPASCEWLIELARPRLERARVYSSVDRTTTVSSTRTNTAAIFNIMLTDLANLLVQARIAATVGTRLGHLEAATVLHYDPGEQITPHYDFIHPDSPNYAQQIQAAGQRRITFLGYLNDDYQGGETEFPELGLSHRGSAGSALWFINTSGARETPDLRTLHAGRPPRSGEKWILSQFIRQSPVIAVAV